MIPAVLAGAQAERKLCAQAHAQALADNPEATEIEITLLAGRPFATVHYADGGTRQYSVVLNKEAKVGVTVKDILRMEERINDDVAEYCGSVLALIEDQQRKLRELEDENRTLARRIVVK